ncbi:MAG: glycosyltransferase [candidate division SR1 bacterium]|nr:glycosyltransferase [candidate division SR1 bacterium]
MSPTRANDAHTLSRLLLALMDQTYQTFEVLLVCDRRFTPEEWSDFSTMILSEQGDIGSKLSENMRQKIRPFSHQNSKFMPLSPGGASATRNFGICQARGDFIQLFDDDNTVGSQYLEQELAYYEQYTEIFNQKIVLTPKLLWRDTETIQNQGFLKYNYRLARPQVYFLSENQSYAEISMFSGNGVFSTADLIKETLYDEKFARIAEDLDFVYRLKQNGAKILNISALELRHRERDKTPLEQARIGTPRSAEQKIKNIFLRVRKHANLIQKIIFIFWSSRGITLWLSVKALYYGGDEKRSIIGGLIRGYLRGQKVFFSLKN